MSKEQEQDTTLTMYDGVKQTLIKISVHLIAINPDSPKKMRLFDVTERWSGQPSKVWMVIQLYKVIKYQNASM